MIREFSFKLSSRIFVGTNAVRFNQNDVIDEHSVDQDEQKGLRKNAKVVDPTDSE